MAASADSPLVPELLLARQPLLDPRGRTVGFELLHRSTRHGPSGLQPSAATAQVLLAALADIGLERVVGSVPAWVNVTREFLLDIRSLPLAPEHVVIELLEDQEVDAELLDVLDLLSRDGFRIALDDFRYEAALEPLLDVAWAVKLDVLALSPDELAAHVERLRARDLMLVAEKVETREMYERCRALGFDAFQGYYFTRPAVMRARPAPTRHAGALAGLAAAGATPSFEELERLIAQDAGLCFRLLRFANSAHIGTRHRIGSVRQALTLLGARSVARWATLVILSDTGDHPHQLLVTALTRARLCELLAAGDPAADPDRAFTTGLFSVADALLEAPMEAVLAELPLDERLAGALLLQSGAEGRLLAAALAHERADWARLGEAPPTLAGASWEAPGWADGLAGAVVA